MVHTCDSGSFIIAETKKIMKKEIGILGVGNLLCTDEGFGIHVIRYLQSHYDLPDEVELMDGGTLGLMLAPFFERVERAVVIDVVESDEPPGTILCFSYSDFRAEANIHTRMSPHQLGILEILEVCKLRGMEPQNVEFICAVPKDLSPGTELSPALAPMVPGVAMMISERLRSVFPNLEEKRRLNA